MEMQTANEPSISKKGGHSHHVPNRVQSGESKGHREVLQSNGDGVDEKKVRSRRSGLSSRLPEVNVSHGPGGGNFALHVPEHKGEESNANAVREGSKALTSGGNLIGVTSHSDSSGDCSLEKLCTGNPECSQNSGAVPAASTSSRKVSHHSPAKKSSLLATYSETPCTDPPVVPSLNTQFRADPNKNLLGICEIGSSLPSSKDPNSYPSQEVDASNSTSNHVKHEPEEEKKAQCSPELPSQTVLFTSCSAGTLPEKGIEKVFPQDNRMVSSNTHSGSRDSPCLHHPTFSKTEKDYMHFTAGTEKDTKEVSRSLGKANNEKEKCSSPSFSTHKHLPMKGIKLHQHSTNTSSSAGAKDTEKIENREKPPPPASSFSSAADIPSECAVDTTSDGLKSSLSEDLASKVKKVSALHVLTCYLKSLYTELREHKVKKEREILCKESYSSGHGERLNNGYDDLNGHYRVIMEETILDRYVVISMLGFGSFGKVVRCYDMKWGMFIALKITRAGKMFREQAKLEVNILQAVNRLPGTKHLAVRLLKVFDWQGHLVLSFELLGRNLFEEMLITGLDGLSLSFIRDVSYQILVILQKMHQHRPHGIIHCDLKPENVLLRGYHRASLIDFGSACYEGHCMHTYIQSRFYRSPEVIFHLPYDTAIDRWSLGCMMVELYTGAPLFEGRDEREQIGLFESTLGPVPQDMLRQSIHARKFYTYANNAYKLTETSSRKRTLESIVMNHHTRQDTVPNTPKIENSSESVPQSTTDQALAASESTEPSREDFLDVVRSLLAYRPKDRISYEDALCHKFFENSPFVGAFTFSSSQPTEDKKDEKVEGMEVV